MEVVRSRCITVTDVPAKLPKDQLLQSIRTHLSHDGQIKEAKQIEIESDQNLTRWILLLQSHTDAKELIDLGSGDIQFEEQSYIINYRGAVDCEVPREWEQQFKSQLPGNRPAVPSRPRMPHPRVVGPWGMQSGYYGNVDPTQQLQIPEGLIPPDYQDTSQLRPPFLPPHSRGSLPPGYPRFMPPNSQGVPRFFQSSEQLARARGPAHSSAQQGLSGQTPSIIQRNQPLYGSPQLQGRQERVAVSAEHGISQPLETGSIDNVGMSRGIYQPVNQDEPLYTSARHGSPKTVPASSQNVQPEVEPGQYMTCQQVKDQNYEHPYQAIAGWPRQPYQGEQFRPHFGGYYPSMPFSEGSPGRGVQHTLSHKQMSLSETSLTADEILRQETKDTESEEQIDPRIIEVTGPRDVICVDQEETMELYFQSKRKSGGGPTESVRIEEGVAYVTFKSEEDARRVLEKPEHTLNKKPITVKQYIPKSETKTPVNYCRVKVTGPEDLICEEQRETVEMYFENQRKSLGGAIDKITVDDGVAYITFESEEVARRVVGKTNHLLNKKPITVEFYKPKPGRSLSACSDSRPETEPPKRILLSNLPSTVHDEYLEMFFESKKLNAGTVVNVDIDDEAHTAVIEFEDPEAVNVVLEHQPIEMMGQEVIVEIYDQQQVEQPVELCTVKVTGPSSLVSEEQCEMLEMYFENKKSGGGTVVDISFEDGAAFVTYESEEVARRVAAKSEHVINKKKLTVELFDPVVNTKTRHDSGNDKEADTEEQEPETIVTVKVTGMKNVKSRETVQYYFENEKRSGGGIVEAMTSDEADDDVLYVVYESVEVAQRVADRDHKVDGVQLDVTLYAPPKPPPCYPNKVLIKGLKPTTTEEGLFNFIEAKSQYVPQFGSMISHAEEEGVVMITLDRDIDFKALQEIFVKNKLEGVNVKVCPVPISNCIWVANLAEDVTANTVEFYFENKRKSGGGPVESVQMNDDDTCFVYFEDYQVVDQVLDKKHKLSNKNLDVKRYVECLGRPEGELSERKLKIPGPVNVAISEEDKEKIKFLERSEGNRKALEKQMQICHADIEMSAKSEEITVKCTLTTEVPHCYKLAKSWQNTALETLQKFLSEISVSRLNVLQDIFPKVIEQLKSITISNPEALALFIEKAECVVTVVGKKEDSEIFAKTIREIIQNVTAEVAKEKQKIQESMTNLKPIETYMLLVDQFPKKIRDVFPDLKVQINLGKNEILIEGQAGDVTSAKLKLYEMKSAYVKRRVEKISTNATRLYLNKETKQYIVEKLKRNKIVGVWEVKGTILTILSASEEKVDACVKIISKSVNETSIGIKKEAVAVLKSDKWTDQVDEWHTKNAGKSYVGTDESMTKVIICSTDDIADELLNQIKRFLRMNTILESDVKCGADVLRFIDRRHKEDVKRICDELKNCYVQIVVLDSKRGFKLKGTEDGLKQAVAKLEMLLMEVKQQVYTVEKPGLEEHMRSPRGKESLQTIESTLDCDISINSDNTEDIEETYEIIKPDSTSCNLNRKAKCKASETSNIYTAVGDMTELAVEVIINTTDEKLSLAGGLGKVIARKGGQEISEACKTYIQSKGKLMKGEVYISPAGKLKAEYIVHVVAPIWKGGSNNEETLLEQVVVESMEQASKKRATSIAFPAISCGGFGFPVKKATRIIVEAIHNYIRDEEDCSLTDIYLCDVKDDTVEEFTKTLISVFGARSVQRLQEAHTRRKTSSSDSENDDNYATIKSSRVGASRFHKKRDSGSEEGSVKMGKINVSLKKAEIAKEQVDVIVNTAAKNLDLKNGAVSASILKRAGPNIQSEISASFPKGVDFAEVAVTGGHKLSCKHVFHSAVGNYDSDKSDECLKVLRQLVANCLAEATKKGHSSIAFPAIGTGNLKYPKDKVASEMFSAVSQFSTDNSDSCVQDVRFIVYQKDDKTLQAFSDELKSRSKAETETLKATVGKGGRGSRMVKDTIYERYGKPDETKEDEPIYEEIAADAVNNFCTLKVEVKQGDITAEDSDCIVNSSNEELDLSRGAVSQVLLKKGGNEMVKEILANKDGMKKNGYAWTTAPNLPCKQIIHVVAAQDKKEWKTKMDVCLKEAESKKYTSISFPALGTGLKSKPEEIAESLRDSLMEFDRSKPQCLKDVRVVIFQKDMVDIFKNIVFECPKQRGSIFSNVYEGVKGWLGLKGGQSNDRRKLRNVDQDKVSFLITAMKESVIAQAINRLERMLEDAIIKREVTDSIITRMDEIFKIEIQAIAKHCNVKLHIHAADGKIEMTGIAANVMNALDKIHSIIRDATAIEKQKETADIMSSIVQWYYIEITDTGQERREYDKTLNYRLESAFKNQEPTLTFTATDNQKFVVDFKQMIEYLESDQTDSVNLIRRDKFQEGNFEPPTCWKDFKGNLAVVNLAATDQEYKDVEQNFQASAGTPRKVEMIQRIQNRTLWQQYHAKKKQLEDQNPSGTKNENFLWHGTAVDAVDSINAHGFNRSYCGKNATAFGNGVYFAVQAAYSCQDTYSRPDGQSKKRMYYCRVLTGEYTKGNHSMRVPPSKPAGGPNALFDSVVDNDQRPSIYVIFNDTQAYPEYLITFTN